jgi:epoxide hydrolase
MPITPFRPQISDAQLADLRERLSRTRFPDAVGGWTYGFDAGYLRELRDQWLNKFD